MRILVTGAGGQLGRELVTAFDDHDVFPADRARLDVCDRDQVLQAAGALEPDAIVHAAAWTDVDGCEGDADRALRTNALATRHVAGAARMVGARVCYLSTDYVFDGTAGRAYHEWDGPNPLSVYGRSKLGGERELSASDTIVRTSWVCGRHGRNFVKAIAAKARQGQPFDVVADQHGSPTFADDLATMIRRLVVARLPGCFHVTNQGSTTWSALAREVVALLGLDPHLVRPIAAADLHPPRRAPRPAFAVLDNAALRLSGLPLLPDYHEPLERLVKELQAA